MDRYILLISDNFNFKLKEHSFAHCQTNRYSAPSNTLQLIQRRKSRVFYHSVYFSTESSGNTNLDLTLCTWNTVFDKTFEKISPLQASEVAFSLADKLSYPGSHLLDVVCYISDCKNVKCLTPIIGALKKLKIWNFAEIKILATSNVMAVSWLNHVSQFVSAEIEKVDELSSSFSLNKSVFWRGSVELHVTQKSVLSFKNFEMLQHSCEKEFISSNFIDEVSTTSNLWFGSRLKVVEFIDATSVPLLWFSGCMFLLQCRKDNPAGIKFTSLLEKGKNAALLCRLQFLCSTDLFPPCSEVSSTHWKHCVKHSPSNLEPPVITLCEQPCNIHFVVKLTPRCCSGASNNHFTFHAHALHLVKDIDSSVLVEEQLQSIYNAHSIVPNSPKIFDLSLISDLNDASHYQRLDENFGKFFSYTLAYWIKDKPNVMSKNQLKHLILDCWSVFQKQFKPSLITKHNVLSFWHNRDLVGPFQGSPPEITALRLKDEGSDKHLSGGSLNESVCPATGSSKSKSIALTASEILKIFERPEYERYVCELLKTNRGGVDRPSPQALSDFSSALVTSYHGINFNIDSQGSEYREKECRRFLKKFVKFETLSMGSKLQVPSRMTAIGDTPPKKRKPTHTPRKKSRIAKVAEKLYKKRVGQRKSKKQTSKIVYKTPTKRKSTEHQKGKLMCSPSVHKMALRSVTPTKQPMASQAQSVMLATPTRHPIKLLQTKCMSPKSKSTAKKRIQQQYVRDNKKRLQQIALQELTANGIGKSHDSFDQCVKKLFRVSMAFLKDLKTSKDLDKKMRNIVKENVRLVLEMEI